MRARIASYWAAPTALAVSAVALLWLAASPAQAFKGGSFEGAVNLEPSSQISFDLTKKKKKIGPHRWRRTAKIENFAFEQALAGCGPGVISPISATIPSSVKLKKGRFVLKASTPSLSVSVSGTFVKRFGGAYGEFHLSGSFLVDAETRTCDTGPRGWATQRTSSSNSQRR